jgi:hypothetical protein
VRERVQPERVRTRNETPERAGSYVLYWLQAAQRSRFNPALEYAIDGADEGGLPVVAVFGLTSDYPEANARHYAFLPDWARARLAAHEADPRPAIYAPEELERKLGIEAYVERVAALQAGEGRPDQ